MQASSAPGFFRRHCVLMVLTASYAIAFVDRQILAILQESIKHELHLSDSELGLLAGFSFAIFYAVVGIPLGRLADRWNRRDLVAISMVVWSGFTALSGYASSFTLLLLARIGVGVGEAGVSPASASIITTTYPPTQRAAAMAFYTIGSQIGILVGFMLGGWLDAAVGWRMAFVIAGLPGIVVGVLIKFMVREPARKSLQTAPTPFWVGLKLLAARKTLRLIAPAIAFSALVAYATVTWAAPFLIRVHGLTAKQAGMWLALGVGGGGIVGTFGSGLLADRLALRDQRWFLWLPALITATIAPFICGALSAKTSFGSCMLYLFPFAFCSMYAGIGLSVVMQIAPPQFRATATALFFFIANIFGIGLGSWIIGVTSDLLAPQYGKLSLQYALLYIVPAAAVIAAIMWLRAAQTLRNDLPLDRC